MVGWLANDAADACRIFRFGAAGSLQGAPYCEMAGR